MMKSVWLGLVLVVLGAFCWWFVSGAPDALDKDLAPLVRDRVELDSPRESAVLGMPAVGKPLEPLGGREVVSVDKERRAVGFAEWPEEGQELQLFADGKPAGEARVCVLNPVDGQQDRICKQLVLGAGQLPGAMLDRGIWYQADAEGLVRIPARARGSLAVIRHGDLHGYWAAWPDYFATTRVDLAVPKSVLVKVLDDRGKGAAWAKVDPLGQAPFRFLLGMRADERGELTLSNVNVLLGAMARFGDRSGTPRLVLQTPVLGDADARFLARGSFGLLAPPEGPIELVVASGGTCTVRLVDEDGNALRGSHHMVNLRPADGAAMPARSDFVPGDRPAFFSGLPVGGRVRASVQDEEEDSPFRVAEGVIPAMDAEPLELTLVIAKRALRYAGARLVDETGQPLVDADVDFAFSIIRDGGSGSSHGPLTTDGEGYLRVRVALYGLAKEGATFELGFSHKRPVGGPLLSDIGVLESPLEMPLELGDVVMAQAPVVAAGQVVDGRGVGVPGVKVELIELVALEGGGQQRRVCLAQSSMETDGAGRFELRGVTRETQLALAASAPGYAPLADVPISFGETGARLVLFGAGSLLGSVEIPEEGVMPTVRIGIQPADPALAAGFLVKPIGGGWGTDGVWWDSWPAYDGAFGWQDLPEGLYNLRLTVGYSPAEVLDSWEQVQVLGGVENRDERLQAIEVPGIENWIHVELVDVDGEPVKGGTCCVLGGGYADDGFRTWMPAGTLDTKGGKQLEVIAPGFLLQQVEVQLPKTKVVLERAPEIVLSLAEEVVLGDGWSLAAGLVSAGLDGELQRGGELTKFDGKEVRLFPQEPGRQEVQLGARKSDDGSSSQRSFGGSGLFIDVDSNAAGKRFEIVIPESVLAKLREL